jgi:hypothetical protein
LVIGLGAALGGDMAVVEAVMGFVGGLLAALAARKASLASDGLWKTALTMADS